MARVYHRRSAIEPRQAGKTVVQAQLALDRHMG